MANQVAPFVPAAPATPVGPAGPVAPAGPGAPFSETFHEEYVPLPELVATFTSIDPVSELYETNVPVIKLVTLFAMMTVCPTA